MRLLLDEMYPPAVAEQLRKAGYDVACILEDPAARGLDDSAVCDMAVAAGRAVVTENAADYLRLVSNRADIGAPAPSLIITSSKSFPRHQPSFTGRAVRALADFCDAHRDADPLAAAIYWLRPVT